VGWPGPRSFVLVQVKCPGPKALDQSKSDAPLRIDPQLGHLPSYKFCPGTDLGEKKFALGAHIEKSLLGLMLMRNY